MNHKRLDVHFHAISPEAAAILAELGIRQIEGVPVPKWGETEALAFMDRNQIGAAVVSTSDFPISATAAEQTRRISRVSNDFYADLTARHSGRFGAFASLPLPDVDASLKEIDYALDTLHLDGVMLLSNYGGYYLGDPLFEPVLDELNRRKAVTFIHPGSPLVDSRVRLNLPNWLVEYVANTTRAVSNMVVSGSLSRHPDIRFILAHAGGAFPYLFQRLLLGYLMRYEHLDPQVPLTVPQALQKALEFRSLMRHFYCDTALSTFPSTLAALNAIVGKSHILFGSDYPYAPEQVLPVSDRFLDLYAPLDFVGHNRIAQKNALGLFLRLGDASAR